MSTTQPLQAKLKYSRFTRRWIVKDRKEVIVSGYDKQTVIKVTEGLGYTITNK